MKLGIFGDSYADQSPGHPLTGWPHLLREHYTHVDYHARSGTSLYRGYKKFLQHYKNYDTIVFSFTNRVRWPLLPDEYEGKEFNIGYYHENEFLDSVNPYFFSLFDDGLLSLINSNIHRDIVELCLKEGKYLISVIPFDLDFNLYPNTFPIVTGLDKVSRLEEIEDQGFQNTCKHLAKLQIIDHRACHLNPSNNRIVADFMIKCLEIRQENMILNCEANKNWIIRDSTDQQIFLQHKRQTSKLWK